MWPKRRSASHLPYPLLTDHNPQEQLPWADLVTLDLSLYETPKGRKELAKTLIAAVREKGFFYVKNFGVSQEAVNRQFAIGKAFYDLPLEEKLKYVPDNFAKGGFNGYMPAGRIMYVSVSFCLLFYFALLTSPAASIRTRD
jgi:hypothetical protein